MIRLLLLLILLLPLAQPQPPEMKVIADWAELTRNGRRTATIQWEQTSEATSACLVREVRTQWVLIDCVPGRPGWHLMQIPAALPADGLQWPEEGDQYWIVEQSPYSEHGPYGLEWRYWLPLF